MITGTIAKIELWVFFARLMGSGLVLTNLILPLMGERVLTVLNSLIVRSDPKCNLKEEIVIGFVKGFQKNDLFSLNGGIVRRRTDRHDLGSGREVHSRHYN
jgi:hypothetical protein